MTFGLSIIIQNGLLETFSADSRRLNPGGIETASLPLGGELAVGWFPLHHVRWWRSLLLVGLQLLIGRTRLGRAFRATSDDSETAQLMGIDNRRLYGLAMAHVARHRRGRRRLPRHPHDLRPFAAGPTGCSSRSRR